MIDEAMSILQYKGNKVQDPDQAFRMTLRSFSNRKKKKELLKVKIQEIIFQGCKHCQSPFQPEFRLSRVHKETRLFHIFHLHKLVKTLLFIAG